MLFLKWVASLRTRFPSDKHALVINLDKTSLSLLQPDNKGSVVLGQLCLGHYPSVKHMSYSLNSLKGVYMGEYIGDYYRAS